MEESNIVQWSPADMLEITLNEPDDFLKVRETLTRIGVASRKDKKLYQSCHILHKQGKYYIVHLYLLLKISICFLFTIIYYLYVLVRVKLGAT